MNGAAFAGQCAQYEDHHFFSPLCSVRLSSASRSVPQWTEWDLLRSLGENTARQKT